MKFFCFVLLAVLTQPILSNAQEISAKPLQHPSYQLEEKRKEAETKKKQLEDDAQKINSDLESTQKSLVDIAAKSKKNEERLNELDENIKKNNDSKKNIEGRLKKDKSAIGTLVLALERLDRTPPEAVLARPGAPLETAQSAMLLQSILPDIYGRAKRLKTDLDTLKNIVNNLEKDQEDVKKTSKELDEKRKDMSVLLDKRKKLYADTNKDIKIQDVELREISLQAKNLKDLVARLKEQEKQKQEERTKIIAATPDMDSNSAPSVAFSKPTPIPTAGSAQLPVAGIIRVGYKQQDEIGAESQGLTIESRPNGVIVSPMGGIVRYAGYFKNYGQIIIVEHQKDYHSLIAGFAKIDTVVGQSVTAGEPLGSLPKSSSYGQNPRLYYELRLNGEPVNPSRKFAGL